ncbi:hypothetical protein GCM10023219_12720 [Stakelama sediminis]|uniref:PDZ domain-containing protein n=1 Tax=Stakelama sediminis TaxID=463200 RepID=A0A840YWR8_9SPHN|nr:hypothetical protein [Stakelama sediminis]MBB5717997.1 hypothetical protein [Stakelama sediminis]
MGERIIGGGSTPGSTLRPERLHPVPARLKPVIAFVWYAALIGQVGGFWRYSVQLTQIEPQFAAFGMLYDAWPDGGIVIGPLDTAATRAGIPDQARLIAVNGKPVGAGVSEEAVARRLKLAGPRIVVTFDAVDGAVRKVGLQRRPPPDLAQRWAQSGSVLFTLLLFAPASLTLLVAVVLLRMRRKDDPVALLISLGFLFAVGGLFIPDRFYAWAGVDGLSSILLSLFLMCIMIAFPAFPDGRFRPRWGGWVALTAPLVALLTLLNSDATDLLGVLALLVAAIPPLIRYRRTPPGLDRQQLKWAAFGFVGGMLSMGVAAIAILVDMSGMFAGETAFTLSAIGAVGMACAFLFPPVGIIISLMRYRLWDADLAIGRSIGYASMTLLLAGIWAACMTLFNELLATSVGGSKPLIAAVSTIIAALVFGPARERINGWVDQRFQPGVLELKKVPHRLNLWQHGDLPEVLGGHIVGAVIDSLHARHAAVLIYDGNSYRTVGREGIDDVAIHNWTVTHLGTSSLAVDNIDRRDHVFPVRITLDDGDQPIGALLLGPRSDGSIYARPERTALQEIENPLAAALNSAGQHRRRADRVEAVIESLEKRVRDLETQLTLRAG